MVKVFLGNLPFGDDNVLEADIRAQFQKYGDIAEVILKKGFAFLSYLDERDAEDAVREMDNSDFGGRKIRVSFAHTEDSKRSGPQNGGSMDRAHDRAPPKEGCTSLFVGNIPPDTTIERVKTFFEQFGRVVNVKVLPQKTNNPNISAFIDFEQYGAAARAHEADLKYEGKFLRTDFSSNRRDNRGPHPNSRRDDLSRSRPNQLDDRKYSDDRGRDYDRRRDLSPPPRSAFNRSRSRSRDRSRGSRDDPPRNDSFRRPDDRFHGFDDRRDGPQRDGFRDPQRDDRRDYPRDDRRDIPRDDRRGPPPRDDRRDYDRRDDFRGPPSSRDDRRDARPPATEPLRPSGRALSPKRSWSRGRSPIQRR